MKRTLLFLMVCAISLSVFSQKERTDVIRAYRGTPDSITKKDKKELASIQAPLSSQYYIGKAGVHLTKGAYLQAGALLLSGVTVLFTLSDNDAGKVGAWVAAGGAVTCQSFAVWQFIKAGKALRLSAAPNGVSLSLNF